MKNLILSICLLIAVILCIIINGLYTQNSLNELIDETSKLPTTPHEDTVDLLNDIEKIWESKKEIYSVTVKFDFIYNISKEISSAKAGCMTDDPGTYLAARNCLINGLEYIKDIQVFRWDNII